MSREYFDRIGYFLEDKFVENENAIGLLFRFEILVKIPEAIIPNAKDLIYFNEKYFTLPKNPHLSAFPLNWEGNQFLIILYGTHKPKIKQLRLLKKVMNKEIESWIIRTVKEKNIATFEYQNKKTPKKIAGYWENERNAIKEVKAFVEQLGYFPVSEVFKQMGRQDLLNAMKKNGGIQKFKIDLGFPVDRIHKEENPKGYWKEWENVKAEIDTIIEEIGHFPSQRELSKIGKSTLAHTIINNFEGFMKVREVYGLELHYTYDWSEEKIIEELRKIIERVGFFPNHRELSDMGETKLASQINKKTKGITYLRKKMGYGETAMKPMRYWYNEENVIREVKGIINELGDLPTQIQLREMGNSSLVFGIKHFGGFTEFRKKFGLRVYRKDNYWNEKTIMKNILKMIEEIGEFPSQREMESDLVHAIKRVLGLTISELRVKMGFPLYNQSQISSYSAIKGIKAEDFLLPYLVKYYEQNGYTVTLRKKLDKGRILELVAEDPKTKHTVGVDITTTRSCKIVEKKWNPQIHSPKSNKKGYQHYVDNLIVIVVADCYSDNQYKKWNEKCPKNVLIINWTNLMQLFSIKFEYEDRHRLYLISKCSFRNKDKLLEKWNGNRLPISQVISEKISDNKLPVFDKVMNRSDTIVDYGFLPINIVVTRWIVKTEKRKEKYMYATHKEVFKKDGSIEFDAGHYFYSYPEVYQAWEIRVGLKC